MALISTHSNIQALPSGRAAGRDRSAGRTTCRWTNRRVDNYAFSSGSPITADVLADYAGPGTVYREYDEEVLRRARRRRFNRLKLSPKTMRAVSLGALSLIFYVLLFTNERLVLELSVAGWWSFLVPVSIALAFSFAHGAFTGAFWDAVGLRPHTVRK